MPRPTCLVLAAGIADAAATFLPSAGEFGLLKRQLRVLAALDCRRFVVVCPAELRPEVEAVCRGLGVFVVVSEQAAPADTAAMLVGAEAALSHAAAGPVYVSDVALLAPPELHAGMLEAWEQRAPAVDGIVATASVTERDSLLVSLQGERVVEVSRRGPGRRALLGPLVYGSSRELCETIADEADNQGSPAPFETALTRLMAWYEFRERRFDLPLLRLRGPADLPAAARFLKEVPSAETGGA
jgi:hypothetical protein